MNMYSNGETHIELEDIPLQRVSRREELLGLIKRFLVTEIDCGDAKVMIPLMWPGLIVILSVMGYMVFNYLFYVD